jgi:hypothetical protein
MPIRSRIYREALEKMDNDAAGQCADHVERHGPATADIVDAETAGLVHEVTVAKGVGARIVKRAARFGPPALGVGDSILINFSRRLFAVADSPDSNPAASREFLRAFNHSIEQLVWSQPDLFEGGCAVDRLKNHVAATANRVIRRVDYRSSTTFSCIMLAPSRNKPVALILHSGDSCIFKIDTVENSIEQVSWSSLNFVGRARTLSQVELLDVSDSIRFVLCSDGLQALVRNPRNLTLKNILLEAGKHHEVNEIPDLLMDRYGRHIELPDDIAIVVFDPHQVPVDGATMLLGGEALDPTNNSGPDWDSVE